MIGPTLSHAELDEIERRIDSWPDNSPVPSDSELMVGSVLDLIAMARGKAEAEAERDACADFMRCEGYRECDIPACNCNSWHGGHASRRLLEIRDELDRHGGFNGVTTLGAVQRLLVEIDRLREQVATLREALELHEAWEANIITHGDWDTSDGLPHLTQRQMDALSKVQDKRNAALAPFRALAATTETREDGR